MKSTITTVFFDLDETLVENRISIKELFARLYDDYHQQLGVDSKEVFFDTLRINVSGLWAAMFTLQSSPEEQLTQCFIKSVMATNAFDEAQAKHLGKTMFEHFLSLSSNNVTFNDGAVETLLELTNRGIATGIITNGIEQLQMGKITTLDIQNKVDYVNVSAQARAHKPLSPVFELALRRAGVAAKNTIQVGDHAHNDVAGAIRAGMGGVYYNPKGLDINEEFADIEEQATHHIRDLREVLSLI